MPLKFFWADYDSGDGNNIDLSLQIIKITGAGMCRLHYMHTILTALKHKVTNNVCNLDFWGQL